MNGCFFQQVLRQNLSWFYFNTGKRFFILKPTEIVYTKNFQNSHPFERSALFYVTITGNFEAVCSFSAQTGNKRLVKSRAMILGDLL